MDQSRRAVACAQPNGGGMNMKKAEADPVQAAHMRSARRAPGTARKKVVLLDPINWVL